MCTPRCACRGDGGAPEPKAATPRSRAQLRRTRRYQASPEATSVVTAPPPITWKRINHPSEVLNVGEEIEFKVTNFDREKMRISLGLKQLTDDPWEDIKDTFPINSIHQAKVTSLTEYGFFAELDSNTEGLVHISELADKRVAKVTDVVKEGDEVKVKVIGFDRGKVKLSIKQAAI